MSEPKARFGVTLPMVVLFLCAAACIGAMAWTFVVGSEVEDMADAYVGHVRAGRTDEAYALLCESERARVSREDHEAATRALRGASEPSWDGSEARLYPRRSCVYGHVDTPEGSRGVRVYLFEGEGQPLCVHTMLLYSGTVPRGPWRCDGV